jgi:hypothetical protein
VALARVLLARAGIFTGVSRDSFLSLFEATLSLPESLMTDGGREIDGVEDIAESRRCRPTFEGAGVLTGPARVVSLRLIYRQCEDMNIRDERTGAHT